jgi:long-chain acyl-CoA synthetase
VSFVEDIFARLERAADAPVIAEIRGGAVESVTGEEVLALIAQARSFLAARGLKKGDRCALLAPNSVRWAALDLAMMAEGLIVVPLYARQSPSELVGMMKDSMPSLICCGNAMLAAEVQKHWETAPPVVLFDAIFAGAPVPSGQIAGRPMQAPADSEAVTIIYTSGTSGEPKGVVLNAGNVTYMLGCTNARLDELMGARSEPDRIFHYLPFCFAGSWILLLTALARNSLLLLSIDLEKLGEELKAANPDYFLNVPALLERFRTRIEDNLAKRGGWVAAAFASAKRKYLSGEGSFADSVKAALAKRILFAPIRKNIGPRLKTLICGSAPLSPETQRFFQMLGIPVLQVYGLTETTAICTMDDPRHVEPGRVGPAIPGIEMKLAETGEILVRGPNIFPGYWRRPEATAHALEGGWFHTGDQGEADARGNWRITGRLKNLIILKSGHNVAPEPIEDALAARVPGAQQVMIVGDQRGFLAALVTIPGANGTHQQQIEAALDAINAGMPHYKQIRSFQVLGEAFSIDSGLLTANGKLKRDVIAKRYAAQIDEMYEKRPA